MIYKNLIPLWNIIIDTCKIISLTFGDHVGENPIRCWTNWRIQDVISPNSREIFPHYN